MSDSFTTRTIYRLIFFLLSLMVTEDPSANRMINALEEAEKVLKLNREIFRAIGDTGRADDCWNSMWKLLAIKVEIKHKAKAKVKLPQIRVVWPVKEEQNG